MASTPEVGSPARWAHGHNAPTPPVGPSARPRFPNGIAHLLGPRVVVLIATFFCLYLSHPLTWIGLGADPSSRPGGPLWSPPAGLALVLVAWFGRRTAGLVVAGCGLLLLAQHALLQGVGAPLLPWIFVDTALTIAEASFGWWLFHARGRGSRVLGDPNSSIQFVLLVPGACAALSATARLMAALLLDLPGLPAGGAFLQLASFWLDRALGVLIVAPPLLVLLTPWLEGRRFVDPEGGVAPGAPRATRSAGATQGDWVEIVGLVVCASVVGLVLSRLHGRDLMGWQLWGVQILLIVWASVRQGMRGGTLTASAAAALPLLARRVWPTGSGAEDPYFLPLLQAHLVAQCSAALLVAAAATWVRLHEAGYRQVVAHVPVVIYSARLLAGRGNAPPMRYDAPSDGSGPDLFLSVGLAEVTLASAACAELLGRPAEMLVGDYSRWLACVHPEDRVVLLAALEQLARQEGAVTCEYRLAIPDESPVSPSSLLQPSQARWMRDTLAPHRDAAGRLIGWEGVVTDITEQRRLADDLRRTTSMFHALVANLPTGVFFIQGPHGQPIVVNARARQLLGTREDHAAGLEHLSTVYRLFKQDGTLYPAEELPVYLALKQGRTTMRDDIVVHRPDGRRVPLVTWAAPVVLGQRGTRTATACAVWVLEDLTALHQAEAARKDSESRLRAIIETMAEGLFVLDGRGLVAHCNPAACAFLGVSPEQARGKSIFDLGWDYVDEDGAALPSGGHPSEQALRAGRPVRHVVLGMRRNEKAQERSGSGRTRWVMVNAVPLGQGGVVTTFTDVGAHLQAREAVRVSEERYRGLIESLPFMLVQADRNLRLTYINPTTTALTGYELKEIADPAAWASVVHPEDVGRAQEIWRNALAGQSDRGEVRYRAKDGREKVAFAFTQPRRLEGRIVGATTVLLDVTRERQLEAELERGRRLELIGRLSSGAAHDFNNVLSVVLNLTDLAAGRLPADHAVQADLRRVREAGEQASALAGQMLAFSKQGPQAPRRVDLNAVVGRTLELLRATLPAAVALEVALAGEEAALMADETQVQQVVLNLCLNARDAMPGGGTLGVATAAEGAEVRLAVTDTGEGMSQEVRGRIFEPFFSTKEGGTGLGLAVVRQVVEASGGRIEVQSEAGRGSRFEVRWPRA